MKTIPVKISAKSGSSTRKSKVWSISFTSDFVNELGYVPRLKLTIDDGDLLVLISRESGVLMNRPNGRVNFYYSAIGQNHLSKMSVPFDNSAPASVTGRFNGTDTVRIKAKDLPPIVTHAIKQFNDLLREVKSHIPAHSQEEFSAIVREHKGGETIGDHEALENAFKAREPSSDWSDAEARRLKNELEALLNSRPDISLTIDLNGRVTMKKTVEEEI